MSKPAKPVFSSPAAPSTFLSLLTGWMQQGIASFSATQRIFSEVALRQNSAATRTLQRGSDQEHAPLAILTDLASEGTSSFIEAQRILLSLVQQENEIVMNGIRERTAGSAAGIAMTDLIRRSVDTFIRMQQDFLKTTSRQTLRWLDAVKSGDGYQSSHLVDLAREDMETFVRAQSKFLELISREAARATSTHTPARKAKKTELTRLAQAATNSFIDAQKRLVAVVSEQLKVNLKAASRTLEMLSPARLLPVANITGEGVKELVGAEKALIESIVKVPRRKKPGRMARHRHAHVVHRKAESMHEAHASA